MIDYKKVKEYIEHKNKIILGRNQVQLLKAVIRGDIVYTARGMGRSLIYNGYADYLKEVISKDTDRTIRPDEFDSIFTVDCVIEDGFKIKFLVEKDMKLCPDLANREYYCKF